jgi:formamidopyrimidine-DNA glycosylase
MPELPDVTIYVEALTARIVGQPLVACHVNSPFVVRTVDPPIEALIGRTVSAVDRLGKRIVLHFDELHAVIHLMIAGRLRWKTGQPARRNRIVLADFEFTNGTLSLTEAGTRKRAGLYVVDDDALVAHDRGGLDLLIVDQQAFADRIRSVRHTLKRALTTPTLFSGIGNAYSDEILHRAGLSPLQRTDQLSDAMVIALYAAARATLDEWTQRLRKEFAGRFPGAGQITANRPEFAVHGRFGHDCPVCGVAVQRICYAERETHYCPGCQTGGRMLADRSLSRLLKDDWPPNAQSRGPNSAP